MATKSELQRAIANALIAIKSHDAKIKRTGNQLIVKQGNDRIALDINKATPNNTTRSFR